MWFRITLHKLNILSVRWTWIMRRNLSPISCRLLVCETIMVMRIPIVRLTSRRRLELMSRIRLVVINVRGDKFISVRSMRFRPLHILSRILLRVHYRVRHTTTTIWLPTFLRGMTASAVVTTIILTIRPTLTLSMPPTT